MVNEQQTQSSQAPPVGLHNNDALADQTLAYLRNNPLFAESVKGLNHLNGMTEEDVNAALKNAINALNAEQTAQLNTNLNAPANPSGPNANYFAVLSTLKQGDSGLDLDQFILINQRIQAETAQQEAPEPTDPDTLAQNHKNVLNDIKDYIFGYSSIPNEHDIAEIAEQNGVSIDKVECIMKANELELGIETREIALTANTPQIAEEDPAPEKPEQQPVTPMALGIMVV